MLTRANTFAGLTLNAGLVRIQRNNALGDGDRVDESGTTLQCRFTGHSISNDIAIAGSGTVALQPEGFSGTFVLTGSISGATGAVNASGGILRLQGSNSFGGGLTVGSGTSTSATTMPPAPRRSR